MPNEPLPDYVGGGSGLSDLPIQFPRGTNIASVRLFATKGANIVELQSSTVRRCRRYSSTERGHPVFEVQVAIPPGQPAVISFQLSEPTVPGAPRVPSQPLVDTVVPKVMVPECTG